MSSAAAFLKTWWQNFQRKPPRFTRAKDSNQMPRSLQPDRRLFGTTLALCLIGAVMVFSASAITSSDEHGSAYYFLLRQLAWLALGVGGMFALMNFDYRKLRQPKVIFTALSITLTMLIAVFFLDRSHDTHRWIRYGSFSLQPSELAKLALIVFLAWFLEIRTGPRGFGVNDLRRTLLPALGTVLLVVALVYKEPDMGRSEERRVGKECRSRRSTYELKYNR